MSAYRWIIPTIIDGIVVVCMRLFLDWVYRSLIPPTRDEQGLSQRKG